MLLRYRFFTAILILALSTTPSLTRSIVESDLQRELARISAAEFIPIAFILAPQIHFDDLYPRVKGLPRPERRGQVISELKTLAEKTQAALISDLTVLGEKGDAVSIRSLWISNVVTARVRAAEVEGLISRHPEIARAHWDPVRKSEEVFDVDTPGGCPAGTDDVAWGVADIGAPALWDLGYYGQGVLIANIDMGVDYNHPDLADHIWINPGEDLNGNGIIDPEDWNGIDDDGNGYIDDLRGWAFDTNSPEVMDPAGHGTNTAGIVIGDGTSGTTTGVAPEATMMVLKNTGGESDYWEAQQYAVLMEADVITSSMSYKWHFSGRPDYTTMRHNTDMELAAGLVHSNSIGNQGDPSGLLQDPIPFNIATPGNCPPPWLHPDQTLVGGISSTLGVGAYNSGHALQATSGIGPASWYLEDIYFLDPTYSYPWDSTYNDYPYQHNQYVALLKPDLTAPSLVPTANLGGGYITFGGTSAATPHLGGVFCLLLSADSTASPEALAEATMTSAIEMGEPGKDNNWGCGRLDAFGALVEILATVSATLAGTVSDGNTGLPIEQAVVALPSLGMESLTDSTGNYVIPGIPEGTYDVRFAAAGYDSLMVPGVSFTMGVIETLSVSLTGPLISVQTYQVSASLPWYQILQTPINVDNTGTSDLEIEFVKEGDWPPFQIYSGFPAQIATGDDELFGVEVTETAVWVSGGNAGSEPNKLYRFSFDGDLLGSLDQPFSVSSQGWRDLAWDGQYLYGSSDDYILGIDLDGIVRDSIHGPLEVHTALAYDPTTDHFYVCDNTTNIMEIDRTGAVVNTLGHSLHVSGLAWHPDDEDGMSLYIFSQDGGPAYLRVSKADPGSGEVLYLTDLTAAPGEAAAGAALSGDLDPDRWCFVGMIDGVSDRVQYISLNAYAPWLSVDPPTAMILPGDNLIAMVTFDAGQVNVVGDYEINLVIQHNTPQDEIVIPAYLTVEPCAVGVSIPPGVPSEFAVFPAYPNPFNARTVIPIALPERSQITVTVYNIQGQLVAEIYSGIQNAGKGWVLFDALSLASGVYLYKVEACGVSSGGTFVDVRKMLLLK